MPAVGIDLVDVDRLRASIERGGQAFLDKVYTPAEQAYCGSRKDPAPHYAARFAAKEAAMKAIGSGFGQDGVGFRDFELLKDDAGRPRLELHGAAAERARERGVRSLRVSITHTDHGAAAVVVAEA
ncbi:MAG: holo-ACP synthase [Planctomycetes bacterium]|nr:holo-ACP synthase [Planctomycetota bacterium]MBL7008993.1 holo-ACP synthase [Planctomycetota bacterium]